MSKAWKSLDLDGGGLQTINQTLTAKMKKRRLAYALWLAFPIAAHRLYLHKAFPAMLLLPLLTILTFAGLSFAGLIALLPLMAAGIYELWWIDRRITELNKELRMQLYLRKDHNPPAHYRGRIADNDQLIEDFQREKEQEKVGGTAKEASATLGSQHILSFAEQEKLLREMTTLRNKKNNGEPK